MNLTTYKLQFITPAFISGADQNIPEVRAASIRGQLRWWFRVLGGSPANEQEVFGGIHPTDENTNARASKIIIRVSDVKPKYGAELNFNTMPDFGYIYYFAKMSGNREDIHRTKPLSYFAVGTTFQFSIVKRRPLTEQLHKLLTRSVEAFIRLGTMGLRATRGCGALAEEDLLSRVEFAAWTKTLPPDIIVRLSDKQLYDNDQKCQEAHGKFLRNLRKDNRISGKEKSAFGFSDGNKRESSALHLRPVKVKEGYLPVILYTDKACSQPSLGHLITDLKQLN